MRLIACLLITIIIAASTMFLVNAADAAIIESHSISQKKPGNPGPANKGRRNFNKSNSSSKASGPPRSPGKSNSAGSSSTSISPPAARPPGSPSQHTGPSHRPAENSKAKGKAKGQKRGTNSVRPNRGRRDGAGRSPRVGPPQNYVPLTPSEVLAGLTERRCVIIVPRPEAEPEARSEVIRGDTHTKTETIVRNVLIGTFASLLLGALGVLAMFLGYILGQKDAQRNEDNFLKSLVESVRGEK